MKFLILSLILGLSAGAKVNDFNALIAEDTSAQKELHSRLKSQVYSKSELDARRNLVRTKRVQRQEPAIFIQDESIQIAAPSEDRYFRFKKESKQHFL